MATLKQEITIWAEALEAYDGRRKWYILKRWLTIKSTSAAQNYPLALSKFSVIAETARIFFNIGLIRATLGRLSLQ